MSFASIAVGPYSATYAGADIGLIQDVWEVEAEAMSTPITAGRYGDSIVDGVYRGANHYMVVTLKEWTSATKAAMWPFGSLGQTGAHGRLLSDIAGALILTAITGTPAASLGPTTITASKAIYAPNHRIRHAFGTKERLTAMVFLLLPTVVTSGETNLRHYTVS